MLREKRENVHSHVEQTSTQRALMCHAALRGEGSVQKETGSKRNHIAHSKDDISGHCSYANVPDVATS